MALASKFRRWLNGSLTCMRCGRELHSMGFGFGSAICPDCFRGEERFIHLDEGYWLNRIIIRLSNDRTKRSWQLEPESIIEPTQHIEITSQ